MDLYDFDGGLSKLEHLEAFINSPFLHQLKSLLPAHGMRTKPAKAEPAALVVVGAATIICGSDRAADRELRDHWPRLRSALRAAGLRVPDTPLRAQHFRDYRDRTLGGEFPPEFKDTARDLAAGLALEFGLFPEVSSPWHSPLPIQTVAADGTRFRSASKVRDMSTSRSEKNNPRVVADADPWAGDAWGYNFCLVTARDYDHARRRVILDVIRAPNSAEMDVVVPVVIALRDRVGPGFRCFVYDGAMRARAHIALRLAGILTVNKPRGTRRADEWTMHQESVVGQGAKIIEFPTGCPLAHPLTVTAGMLWEVVPHGFGSPHRGRVIELADVRLHPTGTEADVVVRCRHGHHRITIDPNATVNAVSYKVWSKATTRSPRGRCTVNLADDLRLLQVNDPEHFGAIMNRRNDAESGNNILKYALGLGNLSGSYSAPRLDTDLWIAMLLLNTLAWREFAQRHRWRHAQQLRNPGRRRAA